MVGLVGGWCVWAATTDGGISGRVDDVLGRARGAVESATEGNVDAAARYLDQRYAEAGTYPVLDEEAMRAAEQLGWGVGVEYFRCSAHHAVVQALTARGTVSRLLVDGESWGDVPGNPGCPAGLVDPTPWTAPPGG